MSKMTMKKLVSAQQFFMVMILVTYAWIVCGKTPPHFDIVVAKDGTGNFTRISDAIKAAPINSPNRTFIKIRAGLYEETIVIGSEHSNLTLIGDGMDQTIISGNKSVAGGFQTFETATLGIAGTGFVAQDIAVQNTAGPNGSQAVALRSTSSFSAFFRCKITGFQDTLLVHEGIQFYRECDIYGTVDFIFGHARAIFQNCNIYGRQPIRGQSITITAQNMDPSVGETAIVLHNCTITATKDLRTSEFPVKMYLGRPWSNYSTTVIMQSFIDRYVDSTGWLDWEDRSRLDTVHYIEYDNRGPGANTSGRVRWRGYRALHNSSGAISFTVRRFIKGDDWIPLTGVP